MISIVILFVMIASCAGAFLFLRNRIKLHRPFVFRSGYRGTGYMKMRLCSATWPVPWDAIVLKMPEGVELEAHRDQARGKFATKQGWRINILLKKAKKGGEFFCEQPCWSFLQRIFVFRADTTTHGVTKVEDGCRYLISIGFQLEPKPGEVIPQAKMGKWTG